ncbi:hypothetical protein ACIQVL_47190 [Streptomyces sp. NPDC090499]|uniref:hypothetical protein n=1 Tax=Streptomyces sp. NPDC090499 TaxID=3365965 RepID=UPI0037FE2A5C
MRIDICWWDLEGTGQTIDSLITHLSEHVVDAWREVPGLRLKYWLADREHNRWGAVMLWEADDRPGVSLLPPNQAALLIGCPPAVRERFTVAAAAEGGPSVPQTTDQSAEGK